MDRSSELAKALSKMPNYTKTLKLNVGVQPQQSSQTILSHEYPLSAAFHKSKKKDAAILSREGSPRPRNKHREEKDAFNLSCKYPVLKKEFQSENERDTAAFNRTSDKAEIKHLAGLLGASVGSRQLGVGVGFGVGGGKKSGHSYTYTHLNDDSDKFSEADNTFYRPQHKTKFRHSKSPSKERHIQHNNTSYADENDKRALPMIRNSSRGEVEVGVLLREISRLEGVIESYQSVLLKMKQKYIELQEKVAEKVLNDHYIDVLKQQLQKMQENNHRLNVTLQTQRQAISQFQSLLVERIRQVREHFEAEVQQGVQLARENLFLKRLMMIATSNPESPVSKPSTAKLDPPPCLPQTDQSAFLRGMSKNIEEFTSKWR